MFDQNSLEKLYTRKVFDFDILSIYRSDKTKDEFIFLTASGVRFATLIIEEKKFIFRTIKESYFENINFVLGDDMLTQTKLGELIVQVNEEVP